MDKRKNMTIAMGNYEKSLLFNFQHQQLQIKGVMAQTSLLQEEAVSLDLMSVGMEGMLSDSMVREPVRKKIRDFLGVFPIRGGRVSPNPKTFVI